jgi:signal transduction histidine kinase
MLKSVACCIAPSQRGADWEYINGVMNRVDEFSSGPLESRDPRGAFGGGGDGLGGIIDALPLHVAALDRYGTIGAVNAAWRRYAEANGAIAALCGRGVNYLDVCRRAAERGSTEGALVVAALEALLANHQDAFEMDYACHSPVRRQWFQLRIAPVRGDDAYHFLVTHRDITGEVLARAQSPQPSTGALQAAERRYLHDIDRINRELDEVVYVASHDLRAPLRGITTLAEFILEDDPVVSKTTRERLLQIKRRARRMAHLLDDILLYARAGRLDAVSGPALPASRLVAEVATALELPAAFTLDLDASLLRATVRRMPLAQVLQNLIGNAVKHHDRGAGTIAVTALDTGSGWRFSVCDDGPGIPARYRESVFDMFTTLKPRDVVEGSGMGLALVRRLVRSFGGYCGITQNGARGACVWFDWPKLGD